MIYNSPRSSLDSGFFDVDWTGDPTDRWSTISYCFYLDDVFISSTNTKQFEYRALTDAASDYYDFIGFLLIWAPQRSLIMMYS